MISPRALEARAEDRGRVAAGEQLLAVFILGLLLGAVLGAWLLPPASACTSSPAPTSTSLELSQ